MYTEGIDIGLEKNLRNEVIARKVYLTFPTSVFIGKEELEFEILNLIASFFKIPITSIQVAGSAKTGYSYYNNKEFEEGVSDLDIAIISPELFISYSEIVLRETKGFKDLSKYERTSSGSQFPSYRNYISKGIFRPDLMPACDSRKKWENFFNKLSEKYFELFKSINASIYISHKFFEFKQANSIEFYKEI